MPRTKPIFAVYKAANLARRFQRAEARARKGLAKQLTAQAKAGQKRATALISGELTLRKRYVKNRLEVTPASASKLEAFIIAKKRGVLWTRFKWRQLTMRKKRAGVSLQIKRDGKRFKIRNAFVFRLRAGKARVEGEKANFGIAIRVEKEGRDFKSGALVLRYGPSVSQALEKVFGPQVIQEMDEEMREMLRQEIEAAYRAATLETDQ